MAGPRDIAGNPTDPVFNEAIFSGITPLRQRSVFVNRGPITRPSLVIHSGTAGTFGDQTTVNLPGGGVGPEALGGYLSVSGSLNNDGEYLITRVVSPTQIVVRACFSLPDTIPVWTIFDPRNGQIADDPEHVTVRINSIEVVPEAVIGLLGQVVLPTTPGAADDVQVDYSWICNPTVGIHRLNSQEFRLNAWNRNVRGPAGHTYRYNNVLIRPSNLSTPSSVQSGTGAVVTAPNQVSLPYANVLSSFVGLTLKLSGGLNDADTFRIESVLSSTVVLVDPVPVVESGVVWRIYDEQGSRLALLAQPLQRDLKYRAYERAYTALLNDPTRLVLNVPSKKVSYPPMQRVLDQIFISYTPVTLPELDPLAPWTRKGTGTASVTYSRLVLEDTSPTEPLFWVRPLDLSFPHTYAQSWQFEAPTVGTFEGVWSGIAAGYSDPLKAFIVGFLEEGGVPKIGVLKKGYGNDPSVIDAWSGGLDSLGAATGLPVEFDWRTLHNYRLYRNPSGIVQLYVDGEVVAALQMEVDSLPYLSELNDPFDKIQGAFFGVLSRPGMTESLWDFVRYLVIPTNPYQVAPSMFTSYEGNVFPEVAIPPWTPVGYHGVEYLIGDVFWLSSTSASVDTGEGYVGGDFRGYSRLEPLMQAATDVVLDVGAQIQTFTHGISPNAVTALFDDGRRFCQLSLLSDTAAPKLGYGGRVVPTDWQPTPWSTMGGATVEMKGRILRITDTSTTDGRIYYLDDTAPNPDPSRTLGSNDYIVEFRCQVRSVTPDVGGFAGGSVEIYDASRVVGLMFQQVAGVRYLTFHSEGAIISGATIAFDWLDSTPHTYRLTKNTSGNLVTLFVDGVYLTSVAYNLFALPTPTPGFDPSVGTITFGSSTTASSGALSEIDWHYVNSWRVLSSFKKYAGVWKGSNPHTLLGYYLPLKATGSAASVAGNALGDIVDFVAAGVVPGDPLLIDVGGNQGVYTIASAVGSTLTITGTFPVAPSVVSYRIPREVDWTVMHRYRMVRSPTGDVSVLLDTDISPLIRISYEELPSSSVGVARKMTGYVASFLWGALDPTNLSQTSWDFVRYGVTRSPTEMRIVPPHQVLNQRNVMASPEHVLTTIPHTHTDFWSRSTGQPPQTYPDFLRDEPNLVAYTLLNQGTPLVPLTQDQSNRGLIITNEFVAALNRPEDVLNSDGDFRLNNSTRRSTVRVPEDVLYASLEVYEKTTGATDLLTPFCDGCGPTAFSFEYVNEVCYTYDATTLPENDLTAPTPWALESDTPSDVTRSVFGGILTYGTTGATRTVYRNFTPLPDAPSLSTQVQFRLRVLQDTTLGLGDSQIRLGFGSTPGITLALAFLTQPSGDRYVAIVDQNAARVIGGIRFDWFDGNYHTYRLVRDPAQQKVFVYIDS